MPDINESLIRSNGKSADDHPFQDRVWIPFHQAAVHISARCALIAVNDDIFDISRSSTALFPFFTCRKTCSPSSPQTRGFNLIDNLIGLHFEEGLCQRLISTDSNIILNLLGIDETIIPEN